MADYRRRVICIGCLVTALVVLTNISASEDAKQPRKPSRALTKVATVQGGKDKLTPAMMHAISRIYQGSKPANPLEEVLSDYIRQRKIGGGDAKGNKVLSRRISEWNAIPIESRNSRFDMAFFPSSLNKPVDLRPRPGNTGRTGTGVTLAPRISGGAPAILDGVLHLKRGQSFSISGQNFGSTIGDVRAEIGNLGGDGRTFSLSATATAFDLQPNRIQATVPTAIPDGNCFLRIKVGRQVSNLYRAYVEPNPKPAAALDSATPARVYPSESFQILGSGFDRAATVILEPLYTSGVDALEGGSRTSLVLSGSSRVSWRSDREVVVTVPNESLSGPYLVRVVNPNAPASIGRNLEVAPPHYSLQITTAKCLDESNPERTDLLVTSVDHHDELRIGFNSKVDGAQHGAYLDSQELSGFNDGIFKNVPPRMGRGFPANGDSGFPVGRKLEVSVNLFEADARPSEVIEWWGALGGAVSSTTGGVLFISGVLAAGPAGLIAAGVAGVFTVGYLIWDLFEDGDDFLGEHLLTWDAQRLQAMTLRDLGKFSGTLLYRNSDDVGSYELTYEVVRTHPR